MKLASLTTVVFPGDGIILNINQLKNSVDVVLDIPTIDFLIENNITFFEAEFPTIQSIEVHRALTRGSDKGSFQRLIPDFTCRFWI